MPLIGARRALLKRPAIITSSAPFALDAHKFANSGTTTASATGLSTAQLNDIIIAFGFWNQGSSATGVSIALSDTAGLTWHSRLAATAVTSGQWYFISWALASGLLSADTVTGTINPGTGGFGNFFNMAVFAISGARTASPFDSAGPVTSSGVASMTPAAANTMPFGLLTCAGSPDPVGTIGGGWTLVDDQFANATLTEFQILTASSLVTLNGGIAGSPGTAGSLIDAIVKGP